MKKLIVSSVASLSLITAVAQQASYDLPPTLSYYGSISMQEGVPFPAANYVTTNPVNDGAWIWVPVGSKVYFKNTSTEGATAYKWTVPGGEDADTEDLIAVYSTPGTYDFPTLTAEYGSAEKSFTHDLKIKVGGVAELCHSDNREWGKTYGLGYIPYNGGGGYLGGSNNRNIAGVGNFYKFSSGEMYVDAVNIYAAKAPSNPSDDAKLRVRVYLPYMDGNEFVMVGLYGAYGALEAEDIPMSQYKTRQDGIYSPIKDYAVYTMNMYQPMYCEGYPYLFFAVEGFAYEPDKKVTEDFCIAADVTPGRSMDVVDYNNALAHNSFARQKDEADYMRPISVFGGAAYNPLASNWTPYSFWICPMVRGSETPAGIEDVIIGSDASKISVARNGDIISVSGVADGLVTVYSLNGVNHLSAEAANGGVVFNVAGLSNGIYIIASADGSTIKFVK